VQASSHGAAATGHRECPKASRVAATSIGNPMPPPSRMNHVCARPACIEEVHFMNAAPRRTASACQPYPNIAAAAKRRTTRANEHRQKRAVDRLGFRALIFAGDVGPTRHHGQCGSIVAGFGFGLSRPYQPESSANRCLIGRQPSSSMPSGLEDSSDLTSGQLENAWWRDRAAGQTLRRRRSGPKTDL
jgi:hypothetical protein